MGLARRRGVHGRGMARVVRTFGDTPNVRTSAVAPCLNFFALGALGAVAAHERASSTRGRGYRTRGQIFVVVTVTVVTVVVEDGIDAFVQEWRRMMRR